MQTETQSVPLDYVAIEQRARQMRAEAFVGGLRSARRWVAERLTGQPRTA